MKTFSGFASGSKAVSVPEQFFTELLPLIDDVLELKVTLACLRLFDQKSGLARWTTPDELDHDPSLADVTAGLAHGVIKAIARGSIVGAVDRSGGQWLFLSDELGRAAAASIAHGESIEQTARRQAASQYLHAVRADHRRAVAANRRSTARRGEGVCAEVDRRGVHGSGPAKRALVGIRAQDSG